MKKSSVQAARRIAQITFDPGLSAKWNEEQRQLLQSRIRTWTIILGLLVALIMIRAFGFFGAWSKLSVGPKLGAIGGCLGFVGLGILVLRLKSPSLIWLRRLEIALTAVASVVVFSWSYGWLTKGITLISPPSLALQDLFRSVYWVVSPDRTTHFQIGAALISFPVGNNWGLLAGFYGVIIPNTWRRSAAVAGALMLGSGMTILLAAWHNPSLRPYTIDNVTSCLFVVGVPGAVCAYIGGKIQSLRRAVFDAEQVGQYRLGRLLGKGAMGEVYLAQHRLLRRPCAVKLIRPEQAGSENWLVRFEREVQAMAQLTHPNTVEIYDFGRTDDNSFFYAMEYLPGTTLDSLIRTYGPLPPARVIYLLRQVCGALSEAHEKGLVHRDIKPGSVTAEEKRGSSIDQKAAW